MTEPVLAREEALSLVWMVSDILAEIRAIRRALEDDNGEEEEEDGL